MNGQAGKSSMTLSVIYCLVNLTYCLFSALTGPYDRGLKNHSPQCKDQAEPVLCKLVLITESMFLKLSSAGQRKSTVCTERVSTSDEFHLCHCIIIQKPSLLESALVLPHIPQLAETTLEIRKLLALRHVEEKKSLDKRGIVLWTACWS